MAANRTGSAGGRANESGSVYRASFGAYLVAYGLADHDVSFDTISPGVPQWLWFESDAPVDDLAVRFSSGARWDIQATAKCDWGAKFRATTAQWVEAVRGGRHAPDDRVALASAKLTEPLVNLRNALQRARDGGAFTPLETAAMTRLRKDAQTDGWLDLFDQVTRSAVIIQLDCATKLDPGFREAAVLLEGTAVGNGAGHSAMAALRDFVHVEAARAGSSRPDRWIKVLADVPLKLGPTAPTSDLVTAVRLAAYRKVLAEELDRLPLTFLGIAAEPLHVTDLLDRFRIELPGTDSEGQTHSGGLAEIARRWPALCVVGAAGAGKSTSMRQLAAAWAADVEAPVPILVPMHRLVRPLRDKEPLPIASVVALGLAIDAELVPTLVERLQRGTAALVLDGLDECRDQQDAAVQLIRDLVPDLHQSAGLVVSARDAVAGKAAATGLPVATLSEPHQLTDVARDILTLVIKTTRPGHTATELAQARAWMSQSQSDHPDMWKVPLFSALLAAHAGGTPSSSLPSNRADALVAAIKDSVGTWERVKHDEPTAWHADLTPDQLVDGFKAMGHATAGGSATRREATTEVVELFTTRWGLAAAAQEKAEEVLAWWIGRVGAFTDLDGEIRPALRLFGEIADAMWASTQPDDVARAWMEAAVADVSQYREPILLAASLSTTMSATLMASATSPDAVLLAAKAISVGIEVTDDEPLLIAQRLLDLSEPPKSKKMGDGVKGLLAAIGRSQTEYDGPTWRFRLALAQLPPRKPINTVQASAIAAEGEDERRLVLGTLTAAAGCHLESRVPTDAEAEVLQGLLDLPAPKPDPPAKNESRRVFVIGRSTPIVSGRIDAMAQAIGLVSLTDDQAEAAVAMAGRGSMGDSHKLYDAINKAGYSELLREKGPMAGMTAAVRSFASMYDDDKQTIFILEQATAAATQRAPEPSWRLEGAAALFELLGIEHQQIGHIDWAVKKQPGLVANLVQLAARSPQLDTSQVAADAIAATELVRHAPLSGWLFLLQPADPRRTTEPEWPKASKGDLPWLRECSRSPSNWLAVCGAVLISNMTDIDGDALLLDEIGEINPEYRMRLAAALLAGTETDELQTKWLAHPDQLVKAAAARELGKRRLDPSLLDALMSDLDLTIRFAALRSTAEVEGDAFERAAATAVTSEPALWTCTDCGEAQSMKDRDCGSCSRGSRSEMTGELKSLREKRAKATGS